MEFKKSLREGYVKMIPKDNLRAKSLIKVADDALLAVREWRLQEHNYNSIIRELYEAFRQYCEAIGYLYGYKFASHEAITYFLQSLKEDDAALKFDRYRKLRNGINYYGRNVAKETVEKALTEIPKTINYLKKYLRPGA